MARVIRKAGPAAKRFDDALKEIRDQQLKVGYFDTRYPDGTPVAAVAAVQEFGSPAKNIPPRPTLRTTAAAKKAEWGALARQGAEAILAGRVTGSQVMEQLGLKASGDVAKAISSLTTPALKETTIASRRRKMADKGKTGSLTKPLVDTALMVSSVTYQVGGDA